MWHTGLWPGFAGLQHTQRILRPGQGPAGAERLPGEGGAVDEPLVRQELHPLPPVQGPVGDPGELQQFLFRDQVFIHILTSRNNVP